MFKVCFFIILFIFRLIIIVQYCQVLTSNSSFSYCFFFSNPQDCDKNEQENGKTESLNEDSSSQIETKHMRLRIPLKKYKLTGLQNCSKQSKAIEDIVLPVNTMVATTDSDNRVRLMLSCYQ